MKKMLILILVMLLVLVGCKEDKSSSLVDVDQKQVEENSDIVDNSIKENDNMEATNIENNSDNKSEQNSQNTETYYPLIKDNILELNETILKEIVQSYFLVFGFDMSFNEGDLVEFENVFKYMMSAGTYSIEPLDYMEIFEAYYDSDSSNYIIPVKVVDDLMVEDRINPVLFSDITIYNNNYVVEPSDRYMRWDMRPEIYPYFNKKTEMIEIPTNIVDEYILSKFNTIINHSQIKEHNKENNTYTYYPFMGEFYYDISIDGVDSEGGIVKFSSTLTNNVDNSLNNTYQAIFVIKFINSEYKFLSVDIKTIEI